MDLLNKNLEVKTQNATAKIENNKMTFRSDYTSEAIYDNNFNIVSVKIENQEWKDDILLQKDKVGLLQKYKMYNPKYIIFNFKKINDFTYEQILTTPLPGFESKQIFIFNSIFTEYTKHTYINGVELETQKINFKLKIL